MDQLRPTKLVDIVGQDVVKDRLEISIASAKNRDAPLDHVLFDGPPGLGKTTFATAIANEMGADIQIANGAVFKNIRKLLPYLGRIVNKSVLFIDEIHRCSKVVEEFLYTVMEDFRYDVGGDDISIELPPFTLIGATTNGGSISSPMYDRFTSKYHLETYSNEELATLISNNATKIDVQLTDRGCLAIAQSSRGTPRIANNRLKWVRDYAISAGNAVVDCDVVNAALDVANVSPNGMEQNDEKYIQALLDNGNEPMGLEAISLVTNIAQDTIQNVVEPFLMRRGILRRTPRGRQIVRPKRK